MRQYLIRNNIYIVLITLLVVFLIMFYTILIHKKNTQLFFDHNDKINTLIALNNKLNNYIKGYMKVDNFDIINQDITLSLQSIKKIKNDVKNVHFEASYINILDQLDIQFGQKVIWLERFKARRATDEKIISIILDRSHYELANFDLETKNKLNNIRLDLLSNKQKEFYNMDLVKYYDLKIDNKFKEIFVKEVKTLQSSINFQLQYQNEAINKNIDTLLEKMKLLLIKQRDMVQKSVYITLNILFVLVALFLTLFTLFYRKLKQSQKQLQNLTYQSKLASMGEMIGNIAHQWRQPLTHLSYILMNLNTAYKKDKLTLEYFDKKIKLANGKLKKLSNKIKEFKEFFKNKKTTELFDLSESIKEVINLLEDSFKSHNIDIKCTLDENISIKVYRGEFLQVIFNLLNNAKDQFIKKTIKSPKIAITTYSEKDTIKIEIKDNAGGIKQELLEKIFEPYFTTKEKGLGIGLYMSKMIIEKSKGKLEVKNSKSGALFIITLKK